MKEFSTTACPRNCYSTCGFRVEVADNRIRTIESHKGNLATPEGPCLKGLSYVERVYSDDRLLHPLERTPDGRFGRISWERALERIASELVRARDRHGPQSVFFYAGSGTKGLLNQVSTDFWRLFGGCTTTYGDLCWPAGLEATRLTLGDNRHNAPWDLVNARLIIIWGKNPAETNIHQMTQIHDAVSNGARVVVIDPRRSETAEAGDLLIQIRPGTDGALALGLAHLLIRRSAIDRAFIKSSVLGFEEFAAMVEGYPPERVARITDVPVAAIEQLAEMIATIDPVTITAGFGMQRYTNSAQTMRAIISLLAITGNLGKPGSGWVYANLQSQIFSPVKDPVAFFPPQNSDDPVRCSISTARLGPELMARRDPPITVAWIERGNPVTQNPQTGLVIEAFRSLEFRVVVDQFMTDTACEADIVLPAKSMFEQTDVINAYWHPYIQIKDKLIEPPGEVRPETEIYWHLAHHLQIPDDEISARIPAPTDESVEDWIEERLAAFPELSLERLREGPVIAPGTQEVAWVDRVFPTPSGRIELSSDEAAARWGADRLPVFREQDERPDDSTYPLQLLTPNTKNRIHSQFGNLPSIFALDPKCVAEISPADASSRGIGDGSRVRIFNDRGAIELPVRFNHSLRPGVISVHNGWWISEGGGINLLSAARETDMGHGAAFHDNAVQMEPA